MVIRGGTETKQLLYKQVDYINQAWSSYITQNLRSDFLGYVPRNSKSCQLKKNQQLFSQETETEEGQQVF